MSAGSQRVLVVGLARSGRAAALLLRRLGHSVVAVDSGQVDAPELVAAGVDVLAPFDEAVGDVDLIVKSPGVPAAATPVAAARAAGVPIISEIELAARHLDNPILAVTGTNGKTTTTELTAHLLTTAGIPAQACGNQGTPLSGLVGAVDPVTWLVVECSSFQLEDIVDFHPAGAVLLNVTPDHLDRHGTLAEYRDAKLRIFANQTAGDLAVLPRGLEPATPATPRFVDDGPRGPGAICWSEGGLHHAELGLITAWEDVALRGRHNQQNAMAAVALAAHAGAERAALAEGLTTFPGVPHRLEVVAEINGVRFVNDSKATNPDATIAALDAYPERVHLIVGGRGKGTPFDTVAAAAARTAVVRAYLVGEAGEEIGTALAGEGIDVQSAGTIAAAVTAAASVAMPGDVVLLAPACTSFDQYANFEERGEDFRAAVQGVLARAGTSTM